MKVITTNLLDYFWSKGIKLTKELLESAEMHRAIFRGKNLGTTFTNDQKNAVKNGTFEDLFVGDYWVINGTTWRIVDINYWLHIGTYSNIVTTNHLVIMPDQELYCNFMNEEDSIIGGYMGSDMRTTYLNQAKNLVNIAFSESNILNHKEWLVNATHNGCPAGSAWYDSTVELPNEIMMFGCHIVAQDRDESLPRLNGIDNTQLALMQICPEFIIPYNSDDGMWLRDIGYNGFAFIDKSGYLGIESACSTSFGVRPVFGIYAGT